MKPLLKHDWERIVAYFVLTLALGALLAPWLFLLGKEAVRQGWLVEKSPILTYLHDALDRSPFSRYFNRALMIVALLGLFPLVKSLRFRGWRDLKIDKNPCALMDVTAGILLAGGFLLFMGASFLYMGLFVPESPPVWVAIIPGLLATAATVAILEEVAFRGVMLGVCLRRMGATGAVLLTSAAYALVHFLKPPRLELAVEEVTWTTGFETLGLIFSRFLDWQTVAAEFLTLIVLGIVLAITRIRTRSLWLPIGLHAGWVFAYQLFNRSTDDSPTIDQWAPWVGESLKIGVIPLVVITITGALGSLWIDLSRRPATDQPSSGAE